MVVDILNGIIIYVVILIIRVFDAFALALDLLEQDRPACGQTPSAWASRMPHKAARHMYRKHPTMSLSLSA